MQRISDKLEELLDILDKERDTRGSVTPNEWNDVVRGSEKMVERIFNHAHPHENWPSDHVPFPNILAYVRWRREKEKELMDVVDEMAKVFGETIDRDWKYIDKKDTDQCALEMAVIGRTKVYGEQDIPYRWWWEVADGSDLMECSEVGPMIERARQLCRGRTEYDTGTRPRMFKKVKTEGDAW